MKISLCLKEKKKCYKKLGGWEFDHFEFGILKNNNNSNNNNNNNSQSEKKTLDIYFIRKINLSLLKEIDALFSLYCM